MQLSLLDSAACSFANKHPRDPVAANDEPLWCIAVHHALNSFAKMIASAISAMRLPLLIAMLRIRL
jgi:hypothetical protein